MTLPIEAVCIAGPTASGKSSLAERVALECGSEVVSIDAMQVYRGMDIGTAKVPVERRRCPLHMVDIVEIDQEYSVALFQRDARACIDTLVGRGAPAVLCGGTGLYLDAVIDEMVFPSGSKGDERRRYYEACAESLGAEGLHDLLSARDPASARLIEPANVRRVVRALEMLDGGMSYADHHEGLKRRPAHYAAQIWALRMDRAMLHQRIEQRVDVMFERGLVEEVERLCARGLSRSSTAGQAIGYKEVMAALAGECTMDQARELIKVRTRRYAKRQLSWLRRDGRCQWIDYDVVNEDEALETILEHLRQ